MKKTRKMQILSVAPNSGVPGGDMVIHCRGFVPGLASKVLLGEVEAPILSASEDRIYVRLPESPTSLGFVLQVEAKASGLFPFSLAVPLAAELHPVANPVVAADGSLITTISGSRGQQVAQPLVRITRRGDKIPFSCDIMNPTGLAFSPDGQLYVTSRHDGTVLRFRDLDQLEVFADDLGVPCGIAFDSRGFLYAGDRTGRILRIDPSGHKEEFAELEPSIAAYHLAIDSDDQVYVTGPTFSVRDRLYRISREGTVTVVMEGLARPQGMAFLPEGDLLIATGYQGKKGVFRYSPRDGSMLHYIAAPILVGLAAAGGTIYMATGSTIYSAPLPGTSETDRQ